MTCRLSPSSKDHTPFLGPRGPWSPGSFLCPLHPSLPLVASLLGVLASLGRSCMKGIIVNTYRLTLVTRFNSFIK